MKRKTETQQHPELYIPKSPDEFIGPANTVARILAVKSARIKPDGNPAKLLLYGPPGVGKTRLAEFFARSLTEQAVQIESTNGRNVNLEVIRQWQESERYIPLLSRWSVKIVNELDATPPAAQDLLLTYLDQMPSFTAFIGTSNLDLRALAERFQTRLQQFKVDAPVTEDLARFLSRWKVARNLPNEIAVGCGGNVRAALLDVQSVMDASLA